MEEESKIKKINASFFAGMGSGLFCKFILHPIDTIRAKLIIEQDRLKANEIKNHRILRTIKSTFKSEGISGFYKGIGIASFGAIPGTALYFYSYERAKYQLEKFTGWKNSVFLFFWSGIIAEAVSCVFWVPIDILKERLQVQSNLKTFKYNNTFDAIRQIYSKEGFFALYRAYGATLLSFGPYTGLHLALYDKFKHLYGFDNNDTKIHHSFILAFSSGFIASVFTNPMDIVKVRMQVQRAELAKGETLESGRYGYRNIFHGLYVVFKKEGFLGYFRGCYARIIYMTLQGALNLTVVEHFRIILLKKLEDKK